MSRFLGVAAVALVVSGVAVAQPANGVVAKGTSAAATFLARPNGGESFRVVPANADLAAGELLVTLPGATLESKNKAVTLRSLANYDARADSPVFETAFTLNEPKDADLDLTLDRGRLDVTNAKAEGAATVRVRFRDQSWKVTLDAPGSRVAFELFGRWPPGSRFKPAGPKDKPASPFASFTLLVLGGTASADVGGVTLGLKAPPGPARLEWDSVGGTNPQPQRVESLPSWGDPNAQPTPEARQVAAAVEKFRAARADNPAAAVERFLISTDPVEQRVALVTLGATDDVERLARTLGTSKSLDVWDFGITVVRHWLGRCTGQDQKLYAALTSPLHGYTPAHARIILQLLLGFDPAQVARPETYEVLIEYVMHDKSAIRNLSAWHLVRLVPQGKTIEYKPTWTRDECKPAYDAWKKLIPTGQLPPPPKK
jgi:hypothetical protein